MKIQERSKCTLCGFSKTLGKREWGKFSRIDYFIEKRSMPGGKIPGTGRGFRGSAKGPGFKLLHDQSLRLEDIDKDNYYFQEVEKMVDGVKKVVKLLEGLDLF